MSSSLDIKPAIGLHQPPTSTLSRRAIMLQRTLSTMAKLYSPCDPQGDEVVPSLYATPYHNARAFLDAVGPWLRAEEHSANTILPYAEMMAASDSRHTCPMIAETLWIVCWCLSSPQLSPLQESSNLPLGNTAPVYLEPQLRLILMAGESHMGPLPLFVFAPNMLDAHISNGLPLMVDAMKATASKLAELRPPQRTTSLFGPSPLVHAFANIWDTYSAYPRHISPLRRHRMLVCSPQMIHNAKDGSAPISALGHIRRMVESDIAAVAGLARVSSPSLTVQQAHKHAQHLVAHAQAWVSEAQENQARNEDGLHAIVAFCEVGRRTSTSAVITNLVTAIAARRQGHGARLLAQVIQSLFQAGISSIVAYGATNASASECLFLKFGFEAVDGTEWIQWAYDGAESVPW